MTQILDFIVAHGWISVAIGIFIVFALDEIFEGLVNVIKAAKK